MSKFNVTVGFSLGTTVEFDGNIEREINAVDGVTVEEDNSYWSSEEITSSGGEILLVIEADNEDEAEEKAREAISEGSEVEDQNSFTWVFEDVNYSVEAVETPLPSLDEALDTLTAFAEEKREDEYLGEVARSAIVVIDAFRSHAGRIASLETQVATLVAAAEAKTDHPF
jgi:hypothetical protein